MGRRREELIGHDGHAPQLNFIEGANISLAVASPGGGDDISVCGTATDDADFDDATQAALSDGVNGQWQKDALTPNNVSANAPVAVPKDGSDVGARIRINFTGST